MLLTNEFRKSSFSPTSRRPSKCLVARLLEDRIEIAHSGNLKKIVRFTSDEWEAFLAGVKNNEFEIR